MSNDFLRVFDLNPTIGGVAAPITQPNDPRAMFYFGFISKGQEIVVPGGPRIAVSFSYTNQATAFAAPPLLQPDAVLTGVPGFNTIRYDGNHDRAHVVVWIDPSGGIPPMGTAAEVRVRAWA